MFCPSCGEEIYLIDRVNNVDWLYCEHCKELHTVRNHGPAPRRLESMQKSYFQERIRDSRPVKISINKHKTKVKMSNPSDMLNEAPGKFKAIAF